MTARILYTRHGAATQERRNPEELARLEGLPDDEFRQEILAMNMRQGLTMERGRPQAAELGRRIGTILLPNAATIVALVGPYKRHQESAEIALAAPELAERDIRVIHDPRLAEAGWMHPFGQLESYENYHRTIRTVINTLRKNYTLQPGDRHKEKTMLMLMPVLTRHW